MTFRQLSGPVCTANSAAGPSTGLLAAYAARLALPAAVLVAVLIAACGTPAPATLPPGPPPVVGGIAFESGNWAHDLPSGEPGSSRGYHRAVVELDSTDTTAPVAVARIAWRRPDRDPATKDVLVFDAATDEPITDRLALSRSNDEGTIVFRPNPGSRVYHVYYLPYETTGGYYPRVTWRVPTDTADPDWARIARGALADAATLPAATTVAIQWQDDFHSFFPMQVVATSDESAAVTTGRDEAFLLFAEDRALPIRMRDRLPFHWAQRGPTSRFDGLARPGEYFVFQVGVLALADSVRDLRADFGLFSTGGAGTLEPSALTCFNTEGTDEFGRPFVKRIDVAQGQIQPFWIGVDLPPDVTGRVEGTVTLTTGDGESQTLPVSIEVDGPPAENRGFNDPADQSRLAWLNSTIGNDPDFVIAPYEPVTATGHRLSILGREIELAPNGLPGSISTFFTPEMTSVGDAANPVLVAPTRFEIVSGGSPVNWSHEPFETVTVARGRAEWSVTSRSPAFEMTVHGALEYDGMLDYRIDVTAPAGSVVDDIRLTLPYAPEAARWMLGLGRRGGLRPATVDWHWNVENHQEGVWLGSVNRGLQYVLRDRNYVRPLNTNFYRNQPLNLPPSWYNDGKGGIRIAERAGAVEAVNYSGPRTLAAGDTLHFHIRLLVTPFHALDTPAHFRTRFVHQYVPVDTVKAWGGTVVNIHHATDINPYINYPFYALDEQKAYIDEAHAKGVKVKLYDTIRELTYKAYEIFALRSLGDEIFNGGDGGGHPWLQEHLGDDYHSAWHAFRVDDAAILDKGTSRWTNYYVEGLNWLAEYQQIDGLYLDDIAFSRETVKRMVSVLHRHRDEVVIDLHSANQYNVRDGWTNSAFLYMEHFPFISRLWFGEYFDYSSDPDYWLTEVSGIPFGLMGEMLQDGGHPYRGLLYGMTARKYGETDPRPVWRMMTDFGIDESRMLGYWLESPPVRTGNPLIQATTYVRDGTALVVLASWSGRDTPVTLDIDWAALGIPDASGYTLRVPEVERLQSLQTVVPGGTLTVPANGGLYVLIESAQP